MLVTFSRLPMFTVLFMPPKVLVIPRPRLRMPVAAFWVLSILHMILLTQAFAGCSWVFLKKFLGSRNCRICSFS